MTRAFLHACSNATGSFYASFITSKPCTLSQGFNLFVGVGEREPERRLQAVYAAVVSPCQFEYADCAPKRLLIGLHREIESVAADVDKRHKLNMGNPREAWMRVPTHARIVVVINLIERCLERSTSLGLV